jgi:hypothetical protein
MRHTSRRPGGALVGFRMADFGWRICIVPLLLAVTARAASVTFEDLNLPPESYWNGADGTGGFTSGEAYGANLYQEYDSYPYWEGFAYSNRTDANLVGLDAQYTSLAGGGQAGSANYAVGYVGWQTVPTLTFTPPQALHGLYVTNSRCTYDDMRQGSLFTKQFGGPTGADPDWLKLSITGKNAAGQATDTVDFYLADFRFADSSLDYIVDSWQFVSLTSLGEIKTLEFTLSSSDADPVFGMNTPAFFCLDTIIPATQGGPYVEPGINGYIDPATWRHAGPQASNAVLNPIFRGWATGVAEYAPADQVWSGMGVWNDPAKALGPVTGQNFDIVSLGELDDKELAEGLPPGHITLVFDDPCAAKDPAAIRNGRGYDFAVFENAFLAQITTDKGSAQGQMLVELAQVEVSTNGRDFARFPSVSLASGAVGAYGTIEISNVHNLAGKHPNAGGTCTGTPFDLAELAGHPLVVSGAVDLNDIRYVRLVDVPGSGDFYDDATACVAPGTWPKWTHYSANHPIYDMWPSWGSGGFDLEAIGVLREQELTADINLDGIVDDLDRAALTDAWQTRFGDEHWNGRCDLAEPKDLFIDDRDLAVLEAQWGRMEQWRAEVEGK